MLFLACHSVHWQFGLGSVQWFCQSTCSNRSAWPGAPVLCSQLAAWVLLLWPLTFQQRSLEKRASPVSMLSSTRCLRHTARMARWLKQTPWPARIEGWKQTLHLDGSHSKDTLQRDGETGRRGISGQLHSQLLHPILVLLCVKLQLLHSHVPMLLLKKKSTST